jgi:hypothetical protein
MPTACQSREAACPAGQVKSHLPRRGAPRKYPLRSNIMRGDKQSPLILAPCEAQTRAGVNEMPAACPAGQVKFHLPRRGAPRKYPLRSNIMRGDKQSPLILAPCEAQTRAGVNDMPAACQSREAACPAGQVKFHLPRRGAPRKYPLRSNIMRGDKQSPLMLAPCETQTRAGVNDVPTACPAGQVKFHLPRRGAPRKYPLRSNIMRGDKQSPLMLAPCETQTRAGVNDMPTACPAGHMRICADPTGCACAYEPVKER